LNGHPGSGGWLERLREAGYDVDARPIRAPGDLKALGRNVPAAVVIDLARSRSSRPAIPVSIVPDRVSDDSELERLATLWQLEEALRRIRPEHQEVLVEVSIRGRPYADVAAELGLPAGTVKSRVYYGLRALRVALEELGWDER